MKDLNDNTITLKEIVGEIVIAIASLGFLDYVFNEMVWVIIDFESMIADRL